MKNLNRKFWGTIFIILGLIILLTPFTPGSVLLLIGLDMLFGGKWSWWNKTKKKISAFLKSFKIFKNIEL
ncbi:MAG: hypothetical protein HYT61_02590 [Candidatus Yanofskybacteria bacterium]|nr:hypothetical protein [Candidatus Yanofskybacteria bacterium]